MEARAMIRKGGLAVLGLAFLAGFWVKVRAGQVGAAFKPADPKVIDAVRFAEEGLNMDLAQAAGKNEAAPMQARGAALSQAFYGKKDAFVRTPIPEGTVRKIVRNATASFEVKSSEEARLKALEIAARHGAEIQQDETQEYGGFKRGVLAFRVAPERLDALLRDLEPLGRVLNRSVSTQNLSEEYVDLSSRLANLRNVEKRLTELLAFKTNKLSDVLVVEKEIERVGGEIEETVGRMKYIDSLSAQSVLTLNISEPSKVTSETPGILHRIGNSLMQAFNVFVATGISLLDFLGVLAAKGAWFAIVLCALWTGWKRFSAVRP